MNFLQIKKSIARLFDTQSPSLMSGLREAMSLMDGIHLTDDEFRDYLVNGSESDVQPLVSFITAAMKSEGDKLRPETETVPDTPERRDWVLSKLGLTNFTDEVAKLMVYAEPTVIVDQVFEDWYTPDRAAENANYWNDYQRVLSRNGWDASSISAVDDQATQVLRRLEDPTAEHYLSARGLVVGYVQSGKTANFTALAAKAIDAGYRFIIILAGTMNNLREQTQRRMDKELCGKEAVLDGLVYEELDKNEVKYETYFTDDEEWERDWSERGGAFLSHGEPYGTLGFPRIRRVTTSKRDYQRSGTNVIEIERPDKSKPVHDPANLENMKCLVAVVKKNATVLRNFNSDLRRAAKANSDFKDLPVLVIDDESDQASINTKNQKNRSKKEEFERTAVNDEITQILQNCPRAQYVGYTATPFANVFIDPNDPVDLYPRHFVLMLNEPPAYRGARWFHDRSEFVDGSEIPTIENSQSKAFIRDLLDASSASDDFYDETRRDELQTALDMFVLTGALKKYRETKDPNFSFRHHTMLVHEGVGTEIHQDATQILRELWRKRGYNLGRPIPEMKRLFEEDLLPVMQEGRYNPGYPVPENYAELIPFINEAYAEMMVGTTPLSGPILQVDTDGNDSPNFEAGKVWKVLVGGAKLSRGYTVEGLTISYFRRRAGSADTLMQTGRWFGFRKGYQDLVRLYAPADLVDMFEAAMHDEEIFRINIRGYAELDNNNAPRLTPMMLAPLVNQSLPFLKPTNSSKMFNAYITKQAAAPNAVELNAIPAKEQPTELAENFRNVALPMLKTMKETPFKAVYAREEGIRSGNIKRYSGTKYYYCGTMPALQFLEILESMKWNDAGAFKADMVMPRIEYLRGLLGTGQHSNVAISDFTEVGIILPKNKGSHDTISIPGIPFEIPLVGRSRREGRHDITGTDRKDTYVVDSIAAGHPITIPRLGELEDHAEEFGIDVNSYDPADEPFNLHLDTAHKRGAVLLTLFDDRGSDVIDQAKKDGTYTPPNWEKGEVGVALAIGSPHAALVGSEGSLEWSVRREAPTGEEAAPIVDESEMNQEQDIQLAN
ncbi:hypothetical protein HMPREF1219_01816 [Corynebacterium pyruviciproducens ATCC BAA-1742]|uniref:Putative endonuclease Z1 domain-containing protein n=2 Tax=Corynebacterium pyruviciproducens TaxID=598660 RepID=S2ZF55_9CORY|nr:hypothetical protein HMPREF1219_01816 [Corynebacterium pyruviciproducens ATCC BAA-1742]